MKIKNNIISSLVSHKKKDHEQAFKPSIGLSF